MNDLFINSYETGGVIFNHMINIESISQLRCILVKLSYIGWQSVSKIKEEY